MYTITFSDDTLNDVIEHREEGRQIYGAIVCPYSGIFTKKSGGASVSIPKLVCPYQVNDIIAIQEQWSRTEDGFAYRNGDFKVQPDVSFTYKGATKDETTGIYTYTFESGYLGVLYGNEGVRMEGSTTVGSVVSFSVRTFNNSSGSYEDTGTSGQCRPYKYVTVTQFRGGQNGVKPNCYKIVAIVTSRSSPDDIQTPIVMQSNKVVRHYWPSNTFRPATTMPEDAVRMYARIVSVRAWTVTKDIVDKYLSVGEIADSYPGTAKVIGYYDRGNELLSKIRKKRNKEVLAKTYQPVVTYDLPMVDKYVQYRLKGDTNYSYTRETSPNSGFKPGVRSVFAQAFEAYGVYSDDGTAKYLDPQFRAWQHTLKSSKDLANTDFSLEYASEAQGYNPKGGYEAYVYYKLDSNGYRIPTYATYKTKIVDPKQYLFAWLISGYLCDKDGKITGKWF